MDLYRNNGYMKTGAYRGFRYMVAVRNHIPCCYVEIPKKMRRFLGDRPDGINVHGGISFTGGLGYVSGFWIGWDYGHEGDYVKGVQNGIQWTEDDLDAHCKAAIIQMEKML